MRHQPHNTRPPAGPFRRPRALPVQAMRNNLLTRTLRPALNLLLRGYLRLFHAAPGRPRHRVGDRRGHIIVANHASHLDAAAIMCALPLNAVNRVYFLCAGDYFRDHPLLKWLGFLFLNTVLIDRDGNDRSALRFCLKQLARGATIVVFPEGTRSRDGTIGPFKPGAGLLAGRSGAPVLPVGIAGTFACCPRGRGFPAPGPVVVLPGRAVRYTGSGRRSRRRGAAADMARRVHTLARAAGKEIGEHERGKKGGAEAAGPHGGPVERRYPHSA